MWIKRAAALTGLVVFLGATTVMAHDDEEPGGEDKGAKATEGQRPKREQAKTTDFEPRDERRARARVDKQAVENILGNWPDKPRMVANVMINKYGLPQEASAGHLIWYDNGSWKRTVVRRQEVPHHFPKPHTDIVEQVIAYDVPSDKFDELAAFDGSVIVERTAGELSARCDMEEANFIALNLAVDIIQGRKNVKQARQAYNQAITALLTQIEPPAVAKGLQFAPSAAARAGDPDQVTLPGAPRPLQTDEIERVAGGREQTRGDRAILGTLTVLNTNEVLLANNVIQAADDPQLQNYAKTLKRDHGSSLAKTMKLGAQLEEPPVISRSAKSLEKQGQKGMAELTALKGEDFETKFLDLAIQGHQRALQLIDRELLPSAESKQVKTQLRDARRQVASHLEQAKQLRAQR